MLLVLLSALMEAAQHALGAAVAGRVLLAARIRGVELKLWLVDFRHALIRALGRRLMRTGLALP